MMKDRRFWTWDDNKYAWQSGPFKCRQRTRKGKGKGKGKGGFKGKGRAFRGEEQAQDPEWQSPEGCAWWSKGTRGKKGSSKGKVKKRLSESGRRNYQQAVLDLGCTRSIRLRAAINRFQKHAWFMALRQNFALAISPLCSPTVRQRPVGRVVLFIFRQHLHLLPESKVDKIRCPSFGLYSSPSESSTIGHIVLDLTSLAYQPKLRERSVHPNM